MTVTRSKKHDVARLSNYQNMTDKDIMSILLFVDGYFDNIWHRPKPDMKRFQKILEDTLFFEHASPAVRIFSIMRFLKFGQSKFSDPYRKFSQWDTMDVSHNKYAWYHRLVNDAKNNNIFYLSMLAEPHMKKSHNRIFLAVSEFTNDKEKFMRKYGEDYLPVLQAETDIDYQTSDEITSRLLCLQPWRIPEYRDFLKRQKTDLFVVMGCIKNPEHMLTNDAIPEKYINAKIIKILMRHKTRSYGGKRLVGKLKKWLLTLNENVITSLIEDTNDINDLYIINNMLNTAFGDNYLTAVASKINTLM